MSIFILVVVFGVFISSVSQLLLKKSAVKEQKTLISEYLNAKVIIAYMLFALSVVLNILAMKCGVQLKEIPILESLGYLFVFALSYIYLHERLNRIEIIAFSFITIGIVIFYL